MRVKSGEASLSRGRIAVADHHLLFDFSFPGGKRDSVSRIHPTSVARLTTPCCRTTPRYGPRHSAKPTKSSESLPSRWSRLVILENQRSVWVGCWCMVLW